MVYFPFAWPLRHFSPSLYEQCVVQWAGRTNLRLAEGVGAPQQAIFPESETHSESDLPAHLKKDNVFSI